MRTPSLGYRAECLNAVVGRQTTRQRIVSVRGGSRRERPDLLAVEEPLEIRVGGAAVAVTMRTPGHDFDLVAGFLLSESIVAASDQILGMRYCDEGRPDATLNIVDVTLTPGVSVDRHRHVAGTSACGICGRTSLEEVGAHSRWPVADDPLTLDAELLLALPERLRERQAAFDRTGGVHAAGLFTATGDLVRLHEDVGRHNAVDKVTGAALLAGDLPASGHVLQVSGRASFELVQKAVLAGIPMLAAVSAPSSLAVDLARESGLTLAGFVRGDSFNLYSRPDRVR